MRWTSNDDHADSDDDGSDETYSAMDGGGTEHIPHADTGLIPARNAEGTDEGSTDRRESALGRTWEQEIARWLATLDSGRTRREYEKAVGYFFHTPGVPGTLAALTFDLLLAYRGSLALRAERQPRTTVKASTPAPTDAPHIAATGSRALPSGSEGGADDMEPGGRFGDTGASETISAPSPLAPATVNIRLTALRQFLAHCGLWGHLPDLPPERMRAALRRLHIERRRPYQILAEPEWAAFLQAARASGRASGILGTLNDGEQRNKSDARPAQIMDAPGNGAIPEADAADAAPFDVPLPGTRWGVPRAVRLRQQTERPEPPPSDAGTPAAAEDSGVPPRRAQSGLTGAFTAQRDHALLALALATGLRAIELCALDLGDLAREWSAGVEEWWLILPDAKTKGQHGGRTLPLAPALISTLLDYARTTGRSWARAADRATPLFLSRRRDGPFDSSQPASATAGPLSPRGRLSPQQVRRIVDRVETQWLAAQQGAGAESAAGGDARAISPHALRHSTAIALLEGNERNGRAPASVEHVRGWLGHFDIRTTQGYLAHLDARRHRRPFTLQPVADPSASAAQDPASATLPPAKPAAP
jgi:integrase